MKINKLLFIILITFSSLAYSQNNDPSPNQQLTDITDQTKKIAKTLDDLNKRMKFFSETFTSNQGIRLSEKQQQLLFAFELLNRAEQSLTNLQKQKIELTEKQVSLNTKLAKNEADSRTEAIDKTLNGTTNAEEVRENRRRMLFKERTDISNLLNDIQTQLSETNQNIRQTELFISRIRNKVYAESINELKDF